MRPANDRLLQAVEALRAAADPLERVDAGRRLRALADEAEIEAVAAARAAGVSWKKIGALYGTSKQGAQQRFGSLTSESPSIAGGR